MLDGADVSPLFSPVSVGGLELRNRIVMAPMTRRFSPGGVASPVRTWRSYYARRAAAGVGLIVTEGMYVGHESAGQRK